MFTYFSLLIFPLPGLHLDEINNQLYAGNGQIVKILRKLCSATHTIFVVLSYDLHYFHSAHVHITFRDLFGMEIEGKCVSK